MPRYHNINGEVVQFTAEEETAWDQKETAASALKLTAQDMLKNKLIDGIIKEPDGGAHSAPEAMFDIVKAEILKQTEELEKMNADERIESRINKFTNMGVYKGK